MAVAPGRLLIRNAEVDGVQGLDVRCRRGAIAELGRNLTAGDGEQTHDAAGGVLLPGLHDHHIHLPALAAADRSVRCGPPQVRSRDQLAGALANAPGEGWIRGIGYHESVAGALDRHMLDGLQSKRPVRIQHRSGKMWFLNSQATRQLGIDAADGRLFRQDEWLREHLPASMALKPALRAVSRQLASYGVTGVTEATPSNNRGAVGIYEGLAQHVLAMGDETLSSGPLKVLLDEAALPDIDRLQATIERSHRHHRPVAIHCVTRVELIFALSAFRAAGTFASDRIEHASVADEAALGLFAGTRIAVVTQPNFIAERGDQYRRDVPAADHDHLYRCQGFLDAGIPLGGGTDAPFGNPDPWAAMRAAVSRRSAAGAVLGAREALSPERALALFTTPLDDPGGKPRQVQVGAAADLCLLDRPWREARSSLSAACVCGTFLGGVATYARPTAPQRSGGPA